MQMRSETRGLDAPGVADFDSPHGSRPPRRPAMPFSSFRLSAGAGLSSRRTVLLAVLLLASLQIVFVLVSLGAAFVPSDRVEAELLAYSRSSGLGSLDLFTGSTGSVVDRYSECVSLSDGLAPTPGMNVLQRSLFDPVPVEDDWAHQCDSIIGLASHQPMPSVGYFRYWHGASSLSRPVVAVGGVQGLRAVVTVLLWGSLAIAGLMVARAVSFAASVLLLGPFVLTTEFPDLGQSVPHALSAIAMLLGVAALAVVSRRTRGNPRLVLLAALVVGSAYNFIDLMTNPPGAWALSIGTVAVVAAMQGRRGWRLTKTAMAAAGGWFLGYVVSWLGKWVITGALIGPSRVWSDVTHQLVFRSAGDSSHATQDVGAIQALRLTVQHWTTRPFMSYAALYILLAVVVVGLGIVAQRAGWVAVPDRLVMMAGSLLVPAWFLIVHEQTGWHETFTYRSLAMAAGVALCGVFAGCGRRAGEPGQEAGSLDLGDVEPTRRHPRRPRALQGSSRNTTP